MVNNYMLDKVLDKVKLMSIRCCMSKDEKKKELIFAV